MASTSEAVKEMLVKKSADYAGRQQTYFFQAFTLGRSVAEYNLGVGHRALIVVLTIHPPAFCVYC